MDADKKLVKYTGSSYYAIKRGEVLYFEEWWDRRHFRMGLLTNMQGHTRYAPLSELEILGFSNKLRYERNDKDAKGTTW